MQKTYYAVITKSKNEQDFGVFFPEVDNCFTTGETVELAIQNANEALELHLDDWQWELPQSICFSKLEFDLDETDEVITIIPITVPVRGKKIRLNITMDERILSSLDRITDNRSAFIESTIEKEINRI